jgi:hypothetical protein
MTVDQVRHDKRADAGQHVKDVLEREAAGLAGQLRRAVSLGKLGGFPVSADVHRSLGTTKISLRLESAPGTTIDLAVSGLRGADPVGLVTKLENRLTQLETRKANALADIDHARRQITHARSSIGQPFPHAEELAAARERVREIDEALDRMAQQDPGRAGVPGQEASSGSGLHESGGHPAAAETGTAFDRDDRRISAQPEYADSPAAGPGDSRRMDANRAAVAANLAYRGGDLDQARQLIDQAAALDPSRAALWQQHQEQIAARRLILEARSAHAAGDQQRAAMLLSDARQLDPRMPAIWDGDLDARLPARPASRGPAREASASGPRQPSTVNRLAARADAAAPQPGISAQADRNLPRPSWPSSPARSHPRQSESSPAADSGSSSAPPSVAAPTGPSLRPGTATYDADASVQPAASDQAGWPMTDLHAASQNIRPKEQAWPEPDSGQPSSGKQRQPGTAAGTEPVRSGNRQRLAAPDADWRDQILRQARRPGQPGPSWPHSPALRHAPEPGSPDAGLEPGR